MTERRLRIGTGLTFPVDAVTQTFVIFGKRGSGKSNTAVVMAEEMHRIGAPFVVLDPVSAWWGLKSSFDGTGTGLPVYVFGGPHADLPLEPTAGELMAQLFIEHRIPMILDMKGWTGGERARFVTAFAVYLLGHNDRVPAHVFLEEADAFIPQRPYKGEEPMLGAMDRLIRWGRQEGLGATAVTQRSAKINKDVTTQAETLIAHRTTGPQDREAIDGWIRYHAGDEKRQELLSSLPTLPAGTAWVWSPEWLELFRQVHVRRRETYDSAATPKLGEKRVQPKALAEVDLDRLRDRMKATIERAKAENPKELTRRIRELERELASGTDAVRAKPETIVERIEIPVLNGEVNEIRALLEELAELGGSLAGTGMRVEATGQKLLGALHRVATADAAPRPALRATTTVAERPRQNVPERRPVPVQAVSAPPRRAPATDGLTDTLRPTERAILGVLAQWPDGRSQKQVATLTGYSPKSGGFFGALSTLRKLDAIEGSSSRLCITERGREIVGDDYDPLPTGAALQEHWYAKLPKAEATILRALVEAFPAYVSQDELGERTGYSTTSGGFFGALAKLRTLELISGGKAALQASEDLF